MDITPDLVEEIFLRLPLKSIIKFKTLSKQWRSILESRRFTERRMSLQKKPKILAAEEQSEARFFSGDEELEIVYLRCYDDMRTSLTCEGLVCIPVPGFVNVLNPSTGEFLKFPSGPDPVTNLCIHKFFTDYWWINIAGYWVMGFGKDKVNGHYKVVRMFFNANHDCEILDLNIGEWRKLATTPPYKMEPKRKSTYVNGSIYWIELVSSFSVVALDLHTEEFRVISLPPTCAMSNQVVNLEDRLALARSDRFGGDLKLEVLILDDQEEKWSMVYSINLECFAYPLPEEKVLFRFRPLAVSKKGNLFLCDSKRRLFKYYPETNFVQCISRDIFVISPFVENLVSLRPPSSLPDTSWYRYLVHVPRWGSRISKCFSGRITNVLLTTTLVSIVVFRCFVVSSRS